MQNEHPALSLDKHFANLRDPRVDRTKRHELIDILVIAISCLLCGGQTFYHMAEFGRAKHSWFKTFLRLPHGIPSHDTFNRLLAALDPQQFLECFLQWTQSLRQQIDQEIVAVDGKALRHALNQGEQLPYIVSAWARENGLVLGQWKVADKSNEITAVPELLRVLELAGCIVTVDAMGCQKRIAREIIEADADYVMALKGNHETVHEEVKSFLTDAVEEQQSPGPEGVQPSPGAASLVWEETVEKDHGRLETRRYYQSDHLDWFADRKQWEGLGSVGMVEAIREIKGQRSVERRYYLSSLKPDITTFARAVRGHWSVENQLHWVLDVQMGEDASRARSGHAAENLATLRRLALNLLKKDTTTKRGIKTKQLCAGWDHSYLLRLLAI
jgi:predicted transposase YbfD/YdcC